MFGVFDGQPRKFERCLARLHGFAEALLPQCQSAGAGEALFPVEPWIAVWGPKHKSLKSIPPKQQTLEASIAQSSYFIKAKPEDSSELASETPELHLCRKLRI